MSSLKWLLSISEVCYPNPVSLCSISRARVCIEKNVDEFQVDFVQVINIVLIRPSFSPVVRGGQDNAQLSRRTDFLFHL